MNHAVARIKNFHSKNGSSENECDLMLRTFSAQLSLQEKYKPYHACDCK